jgi:hypothetical protein
MRRGRPLCVESLEERKLLSGSHVAAHARPAVATTPLVISGTLKVDNGAATMTEDDSGDILIATPVSGQLGSLGEVHGTWNTSADEFGDYLGPDTLQLRTSKGSIVVQFNEQDVDSVHHVAKGPSETIDPQLASNGTRAYARTRESGTIELTTNPARTDVVSLTLTTQGM